MRALRARYLLSDAKTEAIKMAEEVLLADFVDIDH